MSDEGVVQTPGELLKMFEDADRDGKLKLCQSAIDASVAASTCFMAGHVVEIDNLKRHIVDLSAALLASVSGESVDPVAVRAAQNVVNEELQRT